MKNKNSPGMGERGVSEKKIITANFPRLVVSERERVRLGGGSWKKL